MSSIKKVILDTPKGRWMRNDLDLVYRENIEQLRIVVSVLLYTAELLFSEISFIAGGHILKKIVVIYICSRCSCFS